MGVGDDSAPGDQCTPGVAIGAAGEQGVAEEGGEEELLHGGEGGGVQGGEGVAWRYMDLTHQEVFRSQPVSTSE